MKDIQMQDKARDRIHRNAVPRLTISLPPLQSEALHEMTKSTGLSRTELIRQAVALLNVAVRSRRRGLELVLSNSDDEVVMKIMSTF